MIHLYYIIVLVSSTRSQITSNNVVLFIVFKVLLQVVIAVLREFRRHKFLFWTASRTLPLLLIAKVIPLRVNVNVFLPPAVIHVIFASSATPSVTSCPHASIL